MGVLAAVVAALAAAPAVASAAFYEPSSPPSFCSGPGTGAGQCDVSTTGLKGVAVDDVTHDVFVVDPNNARVSQFSSSGAFIRSFGSGVADGTTAAPQVCTTLCFKGLTTGSGAIGLVARGIAVDPTTHIVYVVAAATRVAYFDGTTGTFLGEFTSATASPPAPAAFANSSGIAVDTSGAQHYLYLATGNFAASVVDKFTVPVGSTRPGYVCQITGRAVATATECHGTASKDGVNDGLAFNAVKGGTVAVDAAGSVYIAQTTTRGVVSRYDASGGFMSQEALPGAVAVAVATDGHVFVSTDGTANEGGTHIREYDPAAPGTPVSDFATGTIGGSFGLAVDRGSGPSGGHIYVGDMPKGKIWNFARTIGPRLKVAKAGAGTGSVTSAPAGIDCGATCFADYVEGDTVVLTATASVGSRFAGWSAPCSGTGQCVVTVDAVKTVTAEFVLTRELTVATGGPGSGSVLSAPAGIDCGGTCAALFDEGDVVLLTGSASAGSLFAGWSGACTGGGRCAVTMDAAKSVTANFVLSKSLTVNKSGQGQGTVASAPNGISCGSVCVAPYVTGASVALMATPAAGSRFVGWSGACSGTGACQVTLEEAKSVTATFVEKAPAVATTVGARNVTRTSATVRGTVNPLGNAVTTCRIEYGANRAYGRRAPCSPARPGSGTAAVTVTGVLSGLTPDTKYYFRFVAGNGGGTDRGDYETFTTDRAAAAAGRLKAARRALVANGKARLELACAGKATARCSGKLTLKRKKLEIGTVTVRLAGGQTKVLKVAVSAKARSLLKRGSLRVKVAGAGLSRTVTLERKKR